MKVNRDRAKKTIKLTQTQYLNNVLKRFNIPDETKPVSHPIEPNRKLQPLPKSNHSILTYKNNRTRLPPPQLVLKLKFLKIITDPV
jgi:hypothetical protein